MQDRERAIDPSFFKSDHALLCEPRRAVSKRSDETKHTKHTTRTKQAKVHEQSKIARSGHPKLTKTDRLHAKRIGRLWEMLSILRERRSGVTGPELQRKLGIARSTFGRDINVLLQSDLRFETDTFNGQKRYRLIEPTRVTGLEPIQRHAISLALLALRGIAETRMLKALRAAAQEPTKPRVTVEAKPAAVAPAIAKQLHDAITAGERIEIRYRGADDRVARTRRIDPGALHLRDSHLYLYAFDLDRNAWRTFKASRIDWVVERVGKAEPHPGLEDLQSRDHAVSIWSGDPHDVTIKLSAQVARYLPEYPLVADQRATPQPDGSLRLEARVAGLVEVTRWIVSWGQHAEALAPKALRDAVREELESAVKQYRLRRTAGTAEG